MKSKIEQKFQFLKGKTEKSLASLTNQRQVQVPTQSLSTTGVKKQMTLYRKKPAVVEAITFSDLVEYGTRQGVPLSDGYPWSFNYNGYPVTHENNDCYLITGPRATLRFNRGELLVTGKNGELYTDLPGSFDEASEPIAALHE